MLARLKRRCTGTHEHQHLDGGRTRAAEIYPPQLVLEILRGMRDTNDHMDNNNRVHSVEDVSAGDVVYKTALENSGFAHVDVAKTWVQ